MTRESTLSLLDHLCNEARNTMHLIFGLMERRPEADQQNVWPACTVAVRSASDRLLQTIDDVRALAGNPHMDPDRTEEIDFTLCVAEICDVLNLAAQKGAARLTLERVDEPLRLVQNRHAIEQVITRILKLALELSRSGTVSCSLAPADDNRVALRIVPTRSYIASQLAEWLNAQLDDVPIDDQNVKFLLPALVSGQRLHAIGGAVEFECDSKAPTGLVLYLPSHTGEPCQLAGCCAEVPLQILVAEDSDESYALTEVLLSGEHVDRARTGLEAIDKVRHRRFDLVLMDIHMPGLDGYRSIRMIRDWETQSGNAHTPIVVLSSDDIAQQVRSAAQCGCSGYLRKPVRESDLSAILEPLRAIREPKCCS